MVGKPDTTRPRGELAGIWAVAPEHAGAVEQALEHAVVLGRSGDLVVARAGVDPGWGMPGVPWNVSDGVLYLPVTGVLLSGVAMTTPWFTGYDYIEAALARAVEDPAVDRVVMQFDSPGGMAGRLADAMQAVRTTASVLDVLADIRPMAASAAYALAAMADRVVISPTGLAGSLGVISEHWSFVRALDAAGIDVAILSAGRWKDNTSPAAPIDDGAMANRQQLVDDMYAFVVSEVASVRNVSEERVRQEWGAGVYSGSRAVALGLADEVRTGGVAVVATDTPVDVDDMEEDDMESKKRKKPSCEADAAAEAKPEIEAAVQAAREEAVAEARAAVLADLKAVLEHEAVKAADMPAVLKAGMDLLLKGHSGEVAVAAIDSVAGALAAQAQATPAVQEQVDGAAAKAFAAAMEREANVPAAAEDAEGAEGRKADPAQDILAAFRAATGAAGGSA